MTNEDLKTQIKKAVDEAWERGQPVLLSYLGGLNGGEIARASKRESGTLANFIREHLGSDVEIIKHSRIPAAIGAIPKKSDHIDQRETDELLELTQSNSGFGDDRIQLHRSFWTAFRKKVENDFIRYIQTEKPFEFIDVSKNSEKPENFLEIKNEFISKGPNETDEEVYNKILRWLEENKLEISLFGLNKITEKKLKFKNNNSNENCVLDFILSSLDEKDMKRIDMPLDIVWKLRNSKP